MSVLVEVVVGEFDLLEGDVVLHPLRARRRRVRVDEVAAGHLRLALPGHGPLLAGVLVPAVVGQGEVEEDKVLLLRVQALHGRLERGEHAPAKREKRDVVSFAV